MVDIAGAIRPMIRGFVVVAALVLGTLAAVVALGTPDSRREFVGFGPHPYRLRLTPGGGLDREAAFYEARVWTRPDSALDLASLASIRIAQKRFNDAERAARRSLELLPTANPGARLALAEAAQARHDFRSCADHCRAVLAEDPRHLDAAAILAKSELAVGRVDEALRLAEDLVDRCPGIGTLTLRGQARFLRGFLDLARRDFERAIGHEEPGDDEAASRVRTLLGRVHETQGRRDLARGLYMEARRISPANPAPVVRLAELDLREGDVEAADAGFSKAFQLAGEARFLARKAWIRRSKGDQVGALELYARAEAGLRVPGSHHGRDLARLLLERDGRSEEARTLAQAELSVRRDPETLETLAWALQSAGRLAEASSAIREALRTGIRDAALFRRAAEIETALGHGDEAAGLAAEARRSE